MRLFRAVVAVSLAAGLSGCGGGPATPERSPEEVQAIQASLPAPYNAADVANGRSVFGQCRSCHTVIAGGANLTGPNLHGVVGRPAGGVTGYAYSPALKATGLVWNPPMLDAYLAAPRDIAPGTKMSFVGLRDPKDRVDVIAYLMVESAPNP